MVLYWPKSGKNTFTVLIKLSFCENIPFFTHTFTPVHYCSFVGNIIECVHSAESFSLDEYAFTQFSGFNDSECFILHILARALEKTGVFIFTA